ncbi:cytochrome-c peroxidase [Pseudomonas sp. GCM10022186]|uniref:cytochrome-c peroxidase n=1 Tax=Pseudomonas sp. GCM10022186 TaxID=3252650 RepID=UPI003616931E
MYRTYCFLGLMALVHLAEAEPFELSKNCPSSFELLADGTCQLRTLYDFYDSPDQHGGVQARLPDLAERYTPQQIDLGRQLFFDPLLSANKDLSCASCHQPSKGFADGRGRSLGARTADGERTELSRSAPSLWNVGFLKRLMWDGRASTLEQQALLPLFNPDEMGNSEEQLEKDLNATPAYTRLFLEAFDAPPTVANAARALTAFQNSLVSMNSRYDRYAYGDSKALSEQEIRGHNVFRGFVARCSQCHIPPLFTDSELAVIGSPALPGKSPDPGAGGLSKDPNLLGAFRVPTLRNISKTSPYFHAGQFRNLEEVVHFYNDNRGHAAPKDQKLKIHWHVHMTRGPELSKQDEEDIVAFLESLEDQGMTPEIPKIAPSGLPVAPALNLETP